MTHPPDPFDVLRNNNPVSPADPDYSDPERARTVVERTKAAAEARAVALRRRRTVVISVAVLLILASSVAVAIFYRPVTEPLGLQCHQEVSLEGFRIAIPAGPDLTTDACVEYWEQGDLTNTDIVTPGETPPLTACVTDEGGLAILPTPDTRICEQLGLTPPDPDSLAEGDRIRRLQTQLAEAFLDAGCVNEEQAEDIVGRTLNTLELESWTIETRRPTDSMPCMSISLDTSSQTIHLIPIPRSPDEK